MFIMPIKLLSITCSSTIAFHHSFAKIPISVFVAYFCSKEKAIGSPEREKPLFKIW